VEGGALTFPSQRHSYARQTRRSPSFAKLLNGARRVTIFGGAGCARRARRADGGRAPTERAVVHSLRGKEFIEYENPFDVGLTGLLGFSSGYTPWMACDVR